MNHLWRSLVLGIAFGLAAATVETWLNLIGFAVRRFGPGPLFFTWVVVLQTALGALLGVVAMPLLRLRGGQYLHAVALGLCWWGLERWVSLETPLFAAFEVVPPIAATLLVLLGLLIARRRPALPWGVAAVALAGGLAAPQIYLRSITPAEPARAELPPARPDDPDVVLVVLDTVRAANLSTYGYERPTSPELDALAAEGGLFLDATSPSTWSLPSHASLFTGRYPSSHGAHLGHPFLDRRFPTLADVLAHHGYETLCFTSNAWISDGLGLTRGFAWQDPTWRADGGAGRGFSFVHRLLDRLGQLEGDKGGGVVTANFERWARERPPEGVRPAFVFLNFIEAHFPYHQLPHDYLWRFTDRPYGELRSISMDLMGQQFGGKGLPASEAGPAARDMYDGGIVYASTLLGRVVEALRARGTLDRTVLVVLADHGELLGERADYFGHGPSLYQEVIGVPLLIRYPPRVAAGTRVETPVSTLGVFATILDLVGIEPLPTLQVGSLAPLMSGRTEDAAGPILAEFDSVGRAGVDDPQMRADLRYRLLREANLKLVETSAGESLLYDLAYDPRESRDLGAERPAELARMRARMAEVVTALALPALDALPQDTEQAPELDEATRERLRALGYAE